MSDAGFARLALGTAQFGLRYGAIDPAPVDAGAVSAILAAAWRGGIDMLDTAAAYGEAEELVGRLRPADARFAVVGKTAPIGEGGYGAAAIERVCAGVRDSVRRLRIETLDAILVHHAPDLLAPAGERLFRELERLCGEGWARRIGVSLYDAATLESVLAAYPLKVVQLPVSVLDQRLIHDGTLAALAQRGVEVHARSVFLQGIALADPATLPPRFGPLRRRLQRLREAGESAGLSPAALALGFVARCAAVGRVVIGVNSPAQLEENLAAYRSARAAPAWRDASVDAADARELVDPRTWGQ